MSYRTFHTLTIFHARVTEGYPYALLGEEVDEDLKLQLEDEILDNTHASFAEDTAWSDCDDEMCAFSKTRPQYIFKIHGEGDAQTNMWDNYYYNGAFQECPAVITYPEYNPHLLTQKS